MNVDTTGVARSLPDGPDERNLVFLRSLAKRYPTMDAVVARIAHVRAVLTLPKGTIHVVSDVHGEHKKLKHIINNASGTLRPLVDEVFGEKLNDAERHELLEFIYYPREMAASLAPRLSDEATRRQYFRKTLRCQVDLIRALAWRYSLKDVERVFPPAFRGLFGELLFEAELERGESYVNALLDGFVSHRKDLELVRLASHAIRNLLIYELIVAGDLGDRGPRIDKVIDYIMRQPRVSITWGNHDVTWLGACLGSDVCMATVLRLSLRYQRIDQLEEGYGIPLAPIDKLAREAYGSDPAERFGARGVGNREPLHVARMQKAMAIIQFKLEGQAVERNPEYDMEHRTLLHRIDPKAGTVTIDGGTYPLLDTAFPTIDWNDPYVLSEGEEECLAVLRESFMASPILWQQMQYVAGHGSTYLERDNVLIFHGCVPVDEEGNFLEMKVGGESYKGKALFDALNRAVHRAVRTRAPRDLDLLWYLWTGPLSPLFGKDRMATFETYFVADKTTHKETKNPYFALIHTRAFCERVFEDFGVNRELGLIVNGHVPVKVEKGESPVKTEGAAVTIDGAFSEAYGDRGYTLVLKAGRIYLAQHSHFESVAAAISTGADIIPTIQEIRRYDKRRTVGDTERGLMLVQELAVLEQLVQAYTDNVIREQE